jgi:dolichol-phosphate mannosyltransferase
VGDFVVLLNGFFRDPPELIPKLVERARQGADVVCVRRRTGRGQPFVRRLAINAFYRLAGRLTQLELRRDATDFRVLSRRAVNSITKLKEHNRYMPMLYAYVGYDVVTIPYEPGQHETIDLTYSYRERFGLAIDAIVAFSDRPLRYVAILSFCLSGAALVGSGVVVLNKLMDDQVVEGWASLMVMLLLMFSLQFLFLAVISEYISRILVESKHRPLYYVREESGGTNFSIGNILDTG